MAILPIAEIVLRRLFGFGIPGSIPIVQHLTLWVGFLGATLAAREDKLLALATATFIPEGRWRNASRIFTAAFTAGVAALLLCGSIDLVLFEREGGVEIGAGIKSWVAQLVLPWAFAVIAVRAVWRASDRWPGRVIAALGVVPGIVLGMPGFFLERFAAGPTLGPALLADQPVWPGLVLIVVATMLGAPIFAALGAAASLLLMVNWGSPATVSQEAYSLTVSQYLPAIPLFTLTGFLLAEGKSSERLLEVFRALFGWFPGGTAVVTVSVCAFFTAFTGGSGVTILALGGLLLPALLKEGYRENFSLGMLTSGGSLGLLFPPALPLILYGIIAEVPIENLFLGGIVPGTLLVALMAAWGVREGVVAGARRTPFRLSEAGAAIWRGKFELLVPVVALTALFSGFATIVESAALTALYALVVQTVIHRDLAIFRDIPGVLQRCTVLLGGVLIILGVAKGLSYALVDAQVQDILVDWVQSSIRSKILFLLALNLFLLVVGCLMDIFSATIVVVPLMTPLGHAFGIDPVHLGIIFIANLELGYLTPPVGINLFLASYRFERPLLQIYRAVLPTLFIRAFGVLLITYLPSLTLFLPELLGRT